MEEALPSSATEALPTPSISVLQQLPQSNTTSGVAIDEVTPGRQDSTPTNEGISDEEQDNQRHTEEQQRNKNALTKLCESFPWMNIWSRRKALDPLKPLHCSKETFST